MTAMRKISVDVLLLSLDVVSLKLNTKLDVINHQLWQVLIRKII